MDVRWYGCDRQRPTESTFLSFDKSLRFVARGDPERSHRVQRSHASPFFGEFSTWRLRESIPELASMTTEPLPPYLWMDANPSNLLAGNLLRTTATPEVSSYVSTEGTLRHPSDYYKFGELSNYELVWYVLDWRLPSPRAILA
jgi:hypothetical protein